LLLGGIAESISDIATDVVRPSVTLVHSAMVIGWIRMPFGKNTRSALSNNVLDRDPGPHEK